jgi:hypothetical protein
MEIKNIYNKMNIMHILEKSGLIVESSEIDDKEIKFYCHPKDSSFNRFFISIKEK